jgi:hypothetical protein
MTFARKIPCLLASQLVFSLLGFAGASAPCVKAVSSNNGNFLVTSHVENLSNGLQLSTFEIFPSSALFSSGRNGVALPETSWDDWLQWSVVLESQKGTPIAGCPLLLLSDNGEFLVVLNQFALEFGAPAMRIYRRGQHVPHTKGGTDDPGIFVRDIPLSEIWPPGHLPPLVTEATPQWFAEGKFDFSADSQLLIHMTRWGNMVRISLLDGSVWNDNANLGCFLPPLAQPRGSSPCL